MLSAFSSLRFFLLCLALVSPALSARSEEAFLQQFPLRKQTKFFDFSYKRNPEAVEEVARFADGFLRLVHRDYFKADYAFPIRVAVLEDRDRFQEFLRRDVGITDPSNFGIFLPQAGLFATYESSGLGTFAHEILHPIVENNLPLHPIWATEGIPTFFEKFYGYWQDDKLVIALGFQNPWRIQALGPELTKLDLRQILNYKDTQGRFRECEQRMVSMFLWKQGKFKRMLSLIEKGVPPPGYTTWFEAAMEMDVEKATPLWQAYLNEVATQVPQIMKLPVSTVLPDEAAYSAFAARYGLPSDPKDWMP